MYNIHRCFFYQFFRVLVSALYLGQCYVGRARLVSATSSCSHSTCECRSGSLYGSSDERRCTVVKFYKYTYQVDVYIIHRCFFYQCNVVYSVSVRHTFGRLLGWLLRNLADRLADMDVLQRPVKEDNGLSFWILLHSPCHERCCRRSMFSFRGCACSACPGTELFNCWICRGSYG
jgi:hypothetical protein